MSWQKSSKRRNSNTTYIQQKTQQIISIVRKYALTEEQ